MSFRKSMMPSSPLEPKPVYTVTPALVRMAFVLTAWDPKAPQRPQALPVVNIHSDILWWVRPKNRVSGSGASMLIGCARRAAHIAA